MAALAAIPSLRARTKAHDRDGPLDVAARGGSGDQATVSRGEEEEGEEDLFTYRNLQQELLMALLGYCGDVFVDSADADAYGDDGADADVAFSASPSPSALRHPDDCTVRLAPDVAWVAARDRAAVDRLASLGFHFRQAKLFVELERAASPRSAYRQALCAGVTGAQARAVFFSRVQTRHQKHTHTHKTHII